MQQVYLMELVSYLSHVGFVFSSTSFLRSSGYGCQASTSATRRHLEVPPGFHCPLPALATDPAAPFRGKTTHLRRCIMVEGLALSDR